MKKFYCIKPCVSRLYFLNIIFLGKGLIKHGGVAELVDAGIG